MSFYDPVGRIDPDAIRAAAPAAEGGLPILLGWFCGRRRTSLRPSMREVAVSNSLFKTLTVTPIAGLESPPPRPCIFLLLSFSSTDNQAIHTYEYRSFHLRRNPIAGIGVLEPRSLHIVNIGPDFRGHYGSFSPESALPWMHLPAEDNLAQKESLRNLQDRAAAQRLLASSAEGFTVDQLAHLVGPGAAEYTSELENLYMKMILKLEGLARLVEKSSAAVLEQENKNLKLRSRLAGLE
ncbi:hypothetical protein KSP40_PGU012426 [Platanthera guangdongensis]|uniref:Uncharacterized protein n=1 Tax=Platanthera guangdongensis TaxID=2320717 RepID=A0ABR2LTH7_9ASPA